MSMNELIKHFGQPYSSKINKLGAGENPPFENVMIYGSIICQTSQMCTVTLINGLVTEHTFDASYADNSK